jgi:predicted enzyme related to lactoylglutathione lyase
MEYYNIATKDEKGKEGIAGGMGQRGKPEQKITNFIGVSSINEYVKKIENLGGKILMPKTTVPGFGYIATFIDTEGNTLGIWETDPYAQM